MRGRERCRWHGAAAFVVESGGRQALRSRGPVPAKKYRAKFSKLEGFIQVALAAVRARIVPPNRRRVRRRRVDCAAGAGVRRDVESGSGHTSAAAAAAAVRARAVRAVCQPCQVRGEHGGGQQQPDAAERVALQQLQRRHRLRARSHGFAGPLGRVSGSTRRATSSGLATGGALSRLEPLEQFVLLVRHTRVHERSFSQGERKEAQLSESTLAPPHGVT
eukprot:SAG31_NODE_3605_length_4077_cov_12.386124_3_plen_219_part_00